MHAVNDCQLADVGLSGSELQRIVAATEKDPETKSVLNLGIK